MTDEHTPENSQSSPALPEPLIIPRAEHRISRQDLDREALKVMHRLRDAGYLAYLVGGGVRDILLGKAPKDFDISTSARPGQIRKLFRNSRVIGRRFRLVQVFFPGNKIVEVSTFRQRSEYDINGKDKVLASNNTFGSPAEDAFRRDLTINALFYEIENFTIIDYAGGVKDLEDKIIRIVGDPDVRITRDPARIMRVVRHAARTGFAIEPATRDAVRRHLDKLDLCPASRIRDELFKDLQGSAAEDWARLAMDTGLFYHLFGFFRELDDLEPPSEHDFADQVLRILAVVDRLHKDGQEIPEFMLLSLILAPWAITAVNLMEVSTMKAAYETARKIRETLAGFFEKMNIKRGLQDSITRCVATLPLLLHFDKENKGKGWPKWLKRKSYFNDGLQMFKVYREAEGGQTVEDMPTVTKKSAAPAPRKRPSGGSRTPAFARNTKGGVFGFRR